MSILPKNIHYDNNEDKNIIDTIIDNDGFDTKCNIIKQEKINITPDDDYDLLFYMYQKNITKNIENFNKSNNLIDLKCNNVYKDSLLEK